MIGDRVGPYELTDLLGEGAFGEVWAAVDSRLGRKVAIKALKAEIRGDQDSVSRFRSEARNLAGLNHTNITTLLDVYEYGSSEMMIMEFVSGATLESILARHTPFSLPETLAVLLEAAAGLGYAHQRGLTHRDIKPSNLMVSEEGVLKVMDFGIARVQGSQRQTRGGQAVGTPLYLSPEQCRGHEGDERSDQYSLAVVCHELLAGRPPFEGDSDFDLMKAHLEAAPPPLGKLVPGVPKAMERAVLRALAKDPSNRFATIREFADAAGAAAIARDGAFILRDLLAGGNDRRVAGAAPPHRHGGESPAPAQPRRQGDKAVPRGWLVGAVAGCVLAAGVAIAGFMLVPSDKTLKNLPFPPEMADLKGNITSILSGNAIAVNGVTANLYGVLDVVQSYEDVINAQEKLKAVLPKEALCYKKSAKSYQCFEANTPHRDIAVIALEKGVAKPRPDSSGNEYRNLNQPH
ncbi:MAG: serine/threonine-protein kinase [Azospirillaceae bacterium]|nr:serine/threonine-protein kinase [Azospirillaceae bacterium]